KPKDSGIFYVFVCHKGERCSEKAGTERRALKMKEAIEDEIKLGRFNPKKQDAPRLEDYYNKFDREYLQSACEKNTQHSYEQNFLVPIIPVLGNLRLNEITRSKVKTFVSLLVSKKLAKASIRIVLSELCTVFNHAIEEALIESANPAAKLGKLYRAAKVVH